MAEPQVIELEPSAELLAPLKGLPDKMREDLLTTFQPFFNEARPIVDEAASVKVTDATQTKEMARARDIRLRLRKVRIEAENTRKSVKEDALKQTQAIDNVARVIKVMCESTEAEMQAAEEFAEREAKRLREERDAKRAARLREIGADPTHYSLVTMTDEAFDGLLATIEDAKLKRIEEEQRLARERAEREAADKAERERLAAEKAAAEAEARKEREAREAAEREAKKVRDAADRERRDREAAEAKREAEEQAKRDAEAREVERLAAAPDAEKLRLFAARIDAMASDLPTVSNVNAAARLKLTKDALATVAKDLRHSADNLA